MTSSDADVEKFNHTRIHNAKGRCRYKCNICGDICNMYGFAQKHYYSKHKDYATTKNILVDAGFEKKIVENSVAEIRKIVTTKKSVTGRNIESELEEISNKIWHFRLNV